MDGGLLIVSILIAGAFMLGLVVGEKRGERRCEEASAFVERPDGEAH